MSYLEDDQQNKKRRNRILFPCLYLFAVVVCMSFYLNADSFVGELVGLLCLLVILLPWSLVTGIAILGSSYHGGDEQVPTITIITSVFNLVSFFVIYSLTKNKDQTSRK